MKSIFKCYDNSISEFINNITKSDEKLYNYPIHQLYSAISDIFIEQPLDKFIINKLKDNQIFINIRFKTIDDCYDNKKSYDMEKECKKRNIENKGDIYTNLINYDTKAEYIMKYIILNILKNINLYEHYYYKKQLNKIYELNKNLLENENLSPEDKLYDYSLNKIMISVYEILNNNPIYKFVIDRLKDNNINIDIKFKTQQDCKDNKVDLVQECKKRNLKTDGKTDENLCKELLVYDINAQFIINNISTELFENINLYSGLNEPLKSQLDQITINIIKKLFNTVITDENNNNILYLLQKYTGSLDNNKINELKKYIKLNIPLKKKDFDIYSSYNLIQYLIKFEEMHTSEPINKCLSYYFNNINENIVDEILGPLSINFYKDIVKYNLMISSDEDECLQNILVYLQQYNNNNIKLDDDIKELINKYKLELNNLDSYEEFTKYLKSIKNNELYDKMMKLLCKGTLIDNASQCFNNIVPYIKKYMKNKYFENQIKNLIKESHMKLNKYTTESYILLIKHLKSETVNDIYNIIIK